MKKIAVLACLFAASMVCSPAMAQAPPGEAEVTMSNEIIAIANAADRAAPTDVIVAVERAGADDLLLALDARSTGSPDSANLDQTMTDLDRAADALHRRGSVLGSTGFSVA